MATIRTTLTFEFDAQKVTSESIKDRLDAILEKEFAPDRVHVDVDTRWVATLADAPLFGAGRAYRPTMSVPTICFITNLLMTAELRTTARTTSTNRSSRT